MANPLDLWNAGDINTISWSDTPAIISGVPAIIKTFNFYIGQKTTSDGEIDIRTDHAHAIVSWQDLKTQNLTLKEGDVLTFKGENFKVSILTRDRSLSLIRVELDLQSPEGENAIINRGESI